MSLGKKYAMFVYNGDPMCFIHVLLNALDMNQKGFDVKIIIEGSATKLVPDLAKDEHFLHSLWEKVIDLKLIEGVCKACANKMGTLEDVKKLNLKILDNMSGHPGMASYIAVGYEIMIF